ncbi:phage antirepressor protein [Acinetobacter radioresistens]|uniref:phage antirepressor N-terminal domain-containing protein n=1 Tax=Acinetobacter radioresistens TaxID=40216 RepID=UPI0020041E26|nr:phage antirepressor N-terminal domain-containing protein [Acinetobacter radioresistens]MCK4089660.1 phage antirepressor protein [Acinetobacter radioresistens]
MTTMSLQQITVPFHNTELFLIEHNGQPYTPLRQIVQGMGLDWASQFTKIKQKFATCVVEITMQMLGDDQSRSHTCIPVRKLPAWLYSVNPNKVKPELRDTVIKYQEECDDVLWDYWTKGKAVNPRTTKKERVPLKDAVNMLVGKAKFLNYSDAYKLVHHRFNVEHIDEIPYDQLPLAVEYVHHLMGEYIPKVDRLEDEELQALKLLDSETTNKVHNWLNKLYDENKRLKGKEPEIPDFNKESIARAVVTRIVQDQRMLLTINYQTGKPQVQFVPNQAWILHEDNIASIIGDRDGPKAAILPDIIQAAAKRLSR